MDGIIVFVIGRMQLLTDHRAGCVHQSTGDGRQTSKKHMDRVHFNAARHNAAYYLRYHPDEHHSARANAAMDIAR